MKSSKSRLPKFLSSASGSLYKWQSCGSLATHDSLATTSLSKSTQYLITQVHHATVIWTIAETSTVFANLAQLEISRHALGTTDLQLHYSVKDPSKMHRSVGDMT